MRSTTFVAAVLLTAVVAHPALAHFQELLATPNILEGEKQRNIALKIVFTHPMEGGPVMDMGQPYKFGVIGREGQRFDLLPTLKSDPVSGKQAYSAEYKATGPANYIFFLEPSAYWEPEEEKMIIHYSKTVVNAFGEDEGWDQMVGFPVEIRPLSRPFGLWTNNVFSGVVMRNGKPSPYTRIEIEYNGNGKIKTPSDPFVTQVIKSDASGYFSYAMPKAGWWGFAALITGERKMQSPTGKTVPVEEGGLIWVRTVDMK